jgi:hypothetical protein
MALDPSQFKFIRGPRKFIEKLESLRLSIIAARPSKGSHNGIRILQTSNGWVADVVQQKSSGRTPEYPFTVFLSDDDEVTVTPGTVNGLLPSNVLTGLAISGSGTEYVYLTVEAVEFAVDSAILSIKTSPLTPPAPTEDFPPVSTPILIAVISDGNIYPVVNRNISMSIAVVAGVFYRWGVATLPL